MKSTNRRILIRSPIDTERRGAVLIVAMMCLLLTAMILGSLLQTTLARMRQTKKHERALQAQWLAESGIERAAAQLSQNPDYAGEKWRVTAAELQTGFDADITVTVTSDPQRKNLRTILVLAEYPVEIPRRVRRTKQIQYRLIPQPPAPPGDSPSSGAGS